MSTRAGPITLHYPKHDKFFLLLLSSFREGGCQGSSSASERQSVGIVCFRNSQIKLECPGEGRSHGPVSVCLAWTPSRGEPPEIWKTLDAISGLAHTWRMGKEGGGRLFGRYYRFSPTQSNPGPAPSIREWPSGRSPVPDTRYWSCSGELL